MNNRDDESVEVVTRLRIGRRFRCRDRGSHLAPAGESGAGTVRDAAGITL